MKIMNLIVQILIIFTFYIVLNLNTVPKQIDTGQTGTDKLKTISSRKDKTKNLGNEA